MRWGIIVLVAVALLTAGCVEIIALGLGGVGVVQRLFDRTVQ